MKKLSMILALALTLSLYGCGSKQETAVNEVFSDTVVESDSSDIVNEQAQEQASSGEQTPADSKEVENADSDGTNKTETSDDKNDINTEGESSVNEVAETESEEEQSLPEYTVTAFNETQVMYATNTVNIRKGPSTDFERIGSLAFGQEITVTGQADTDWYEIQYGEDKAYVSNKYLSDDKALYEALLAEQQANLLQIQAQEEAEKQLAAQIKAQNAAAEAQKAAEEANLQAAMAQAAAQQQAVPEIQPVTEVKNVAGVILVGDSRFVQMQESVGVNYCTWIAEGGKGYTWFEEKAIPRIDGCVGNGSKIIINLGVNDTRNLQKYITLVNAKAAEWTALGATVYYASVNPVWENMYVTEEQVVNFNAQMQAGLGPYVHWIDSHSYLTSVGYRLVDGLHYSKETYQVIYAYLMSCL